MWTYYWEAVGLYDKSFKFDLCRGTLNNLNIFNNNGFNNSLVHTSGLEIITLPTVLAWIIWKLSSIQKKLEKLKWKEIILLV